VAVEQPSGAVAEHTLAFRLEPRRTALLVVDMQYASACRTTGLGRWLEQEGRAEEGCYRFDRLEQLVVPNVQRLLAFFREHGLDRIFLRLGAELDSCRDLIPHLRELENAFGNVRGQRAFEILDELAPQANEPVLTKSSASAFTSTGIDALLRNLGTRHLVLTGVSTSQCVDLTARDAADRGYGCLVVEDAVAEDRADYHAWTLEQFQRLFGRVSTTEEVLAELAAGLPAGAAAR
jgi:nicotinamidase-related amidase